VDRSAGYDKLIGNISMTDLKEVFAIRGGFKHLYENVFQFFRNIRMEQGLENGDDRAPVFIVHPSTRYFCLCDNFSVIQSLEKMAATHSHRVWIVEGKDRLVGVISLTDFVKVMN
jgi:CBS-domain-containing membrane protein